MSIEPLYFTLAERVREARQFRSMSQEDLALQCGLSRTSIVNIEKARQRVAVHLLVDICAALQIEIKDIMGGI